MELVKEYMYKSTKQSPKYTHTYKVNWFFNKNVKVTQWTKEQYFQQIMLKQLDIHMEGKNLDSYLNNHKKLAESISKV